MEPAIISLGRMPPSLSLEDQARADLYALIATLLLRPPDAALLSALAAADSLHSTQPGHPLDQAWEQLILAAALMDGTVIQDEFDALFISVGTPPVNPYGSHYLTGFMMEKPLAALRDDLRMLGLARTVGVGEPEDHLGALCEAMRILIDGTQGAARQPAEVQKAFFIKHIAPWYSRCVDDIRNADGANFYRHVATFTQAFFEVEFEAFEMEDSIDNVYEPQ
ncbi:MAG: hypothetical protein JWQ23_628 [Herminiimonas sp.]|nr:hypothetical protein [Herminiimonas sp.]